MAERAEDMAERAEDIARSLLECADADLIAALLRACWIIERARDRVEDAMSEKAMGPYELELLWDDLYPKD